MLVEGIADVELTDGKKERKKKRNAVEPNFKRSITSRTTLFALPFTYIFEKKRKKKDYARSVINGQRHLLLLPGS